MALPFTPEQFFSTFADYNRHFWVVAVLLWCATIAALVVVWREPKRWSAMLSFFVGGMWLWNAAAYHAWLFTRINPAAWLISALFAIQAVLFTRAHLRRQLVFLSSTGAIPALGVGLIAYSLAYPFLTMALGHRYPATPTFGLPCPTAILTIGLLLTVRGGAPLSLSLIPIAWAFIGGSAAVLLSVRTDYVLLAAGVLLAAALVRRARLPFYSRSP